MNLTISGDFGYHERMAVIDFHTHVFPIEPERYFPGKTRDIGKFWARSVSRAIHEVQPWLRFLPPIGKRLLDEVGLVAPAPLLLFESSVEDLRQAMREAHVDRVVLIAQPQTIPNEFVLGLAAQSDRIVAAVNVSPKEPDARGKLTEYYERGARILKIHPSFDGLNAESAHYLELLETAEPLGMPVILHTGCFHSSMIYKDPLASSAELFESWFKDRPGTTFVLAHMNYHDPEVAMDLAEKYPNVHLDTSWQPAETITEAVRRVGAERVLFGSDWPLVGDNMRIGVKRIREAVASEFLTEEEAALVLGGNAERILEQTEKRRAGRGGEKRA